MTIPKNLQEKRDELSQDRCVMPWTTLESDEERKEYFNQGFNSAFNLLLPEIEKLLATLREIDCDTSSKHWAKATDAIESWQRFTEGEE